MKCFNSAQENALDKSISPRSETENTSEKGLSYNRRETVIINSCHLCISMLYLKVETIKQCPQHPYLCAGPHL